MSSGGGNDNSSGFFSPGASPPLILAFLSIALFSGAMFTFAYRRYRMRHGGGDTLDILWTDGDNIPIITEVPKLWDFYTSRTKGTAAQWQDIIPIGAQSSTLTSVVPSDAKKKTLPHFISRHLFPLSPPPAQLQEPKSLEHITVPATLQIAVAIAMPSQQNSSYYKRLSSIHTGDEPLEYSLGLYRSPWEQEETLTENG